MAISKEDLRKKRLHAMSVVSAQAQATSDMCDRVVAAGELVARARNMAETAHLDALNKQVADLKEMAQELEKFVQSAPQHGRTALTALEAATPNPGQPAN